MFHIGPWLCIVRWSPAPTAAFVDEMFSTSVLTVKMWP